MFNKKEIPKQSSKEIKEDRFKKIATRRVQEIMDKMRLLDNCTNKNNYYYTEEQVNKIINAIENEWRKVKADFKKGESKKGKEFNLW